MIFYAIYNKSTGEIQQVLGLQEDTPLANVLVNIGEGQDYAAQPQVLGDLSFNPPSIQHDYVVDGVIVPKKNFEDYFTWSKSTIAPDGVDIVTFGPGLPNPTTVTINITPNNASAVGRNQVYTLTDGVFQFKTTLPDTYTMSFEAFPYQTYNHIITAAY